jgi:signal transduction histidine kinase
VLLTDLGARQPEGWLLWVADPRRCRWTTGEAGALALVAQTLPQWLEEDLPPARWAQQLRHASWGVRLEAMALTSRHLAHDFGNIVTTVLGFSQLALATPGVSQGPVGQNLKEIRRGAQNGADLTHQLRLLSRRQPQRAVPISPTPTLEREIKRIREAGAGRLSVTLQASALLPLLIDPEQLRLAVAALLDNALEAVAGGGSIAVSAGQVEVRPEECLDYLGNVQPGPHLRIEVVDSGPGLSAEARRRLFVEPFYTSKPRKRGLGLTIAHGTLHAHRGGLRLEPAPEGGLAASLVIPSLEAAPTATREPALAAAGACDRR